MIGCTIELARPPQAKESRRLRQIILRADDYGLDATVNRGIIELLHLGRLSAVGCLSQSDHWPAAAKALRPYQHQLSVGLHLNLTAGLDNRDQPLPRLLLSLLSKRLDTQCIRASLDHQLDAFEDHWQAPPAFISSHHQVHVLPHIRELVFAAVAKRYPQRPLLCDPTRLVTATDTPLKHHFLRRLSRGFRQQASEYRYPLNRSLGGIYSGSKNADFSRLFNAWMHQQSHGGVVICHPANGHDQGCYATSRGASRQREFDYLSSDAIPSLLECTQIALTNFTGVRDSY